MEESRSPRDASNWAAKIDRLSVPADMRRYGYNLEGRRLAGPQQGFGQMWQRTYRAELGQDLTPERLIADWRAHFPEYWPKIGHFYGSVSAIQPGEVAALTGGGVAMGVMVLYADDTSFTFLTPEGHMFSGLITFSSERDENAATTATISILLRCSDPLFESMWPGLRRLEDRFWSTTLRNLAAAHGKKHVDIVEEMECVDRRRLWRNWGNIRNNSGIHSVWQLITVEISIIIHDRA